MDGLGYHNDYHGGPSSEGFVAEVRQQVQRILRSAVFSKSPQAARLLSFIVERALSPGQEGTRGSLKEYSIAVQVFGRPAAFDPTADNIVRVEVRRVRAKLELYYQREGVTDRIVISIPKGAIWSKTRPAAGDRYGRTMFPPSTPGIGMRFSTTAVS